MKFLNPGLKLLFTGLFLFLHISCQPAQNKYAETRFVSFVADPETTDIQFYWKDDAGKPFMLLQNLKTYLEGKGKKLRFAMNGGMYMENTTPLGLYIAHGKTVRPLNTRKASGNFYLQPNGVFYLTNSGQAYVTETGKFTPTQEIKFATQSGPMLLINGQINPVFQVGSKNLNVRNGVGILPGGKVLFAMSKEAINFHDFATYFQKKGCKQALYLDGYVSRTYFPEQNWHQLDGDFGVIIGVTE